MDGQLLAAGPAGVCRLSPLSLLSASAPWLAHLPTAAPSEGAELSSGSDYFFSSSGPPGYSWTTRPPWNAWATGKGGKKNESLGGSVVGHTVRASPLSVRLLARHTRLCFLCLCAPAPQSGAEDPLTRRAGRVHSQPPFEERHVS